MIMKLINRILTIAVFLAMVVSVAGCDHVRRLAGRPTSAEIRVLRERIDAEELAEMEREARAKAVKDSLARIEKQQNDSLAALSALSEHAGYLRTPADLRGIAKGDLDHRYYVSVGAFRDAANAKRLAAKFDEETYSTTTILTKAGLNVVLVYPQNKLIDAYHSFLSIQDNPDCPKEAWVLVNDNNWKNQ